VLRRILGETNIVPQSGDGSLPVGGLPDCRACCRPRCERRLQTSEDLQTHPCCLAFLVFHGIESSHRPSHAYRPARDTGDQLGDITDGGDRVVVDAVTLRLTVSGVIPERPGHSGSPVCQRARRRFPTGGTAHDGWLRLDSQIAPIQS
jgi:hypothetical protein